MNNTELMQSTEEPCIYCDVQEIIDLWLSEVLTDQEVIDYAKSNCIKLTEDTNNYNDNSNNSFFLLLFNTLYDIDQARIRFHNQSNFFNNLYGKNKSDFIKTIYNIERHNINYSGLIGNFIRVSNITTKDISKIRKLTELLFQIDEDVGYVIHNIFCSLFYNSSKEKPLFHEDNIVYLIKHILFFYTLNIKDTIIKSDAFKVYFQNMVNDNKIEEIKIIINDYTYSIYLDNLKSKITNIFDLNLQNNEILKYFIKQKSYELIAKLLCCFYYSKGFKSKTTGRSYKTDNEVNEKYITDIDTTKLKEKLDKYKKEGYNLLFDSEDIPDEFNKDNFIEFCFKVLSRIKDFITDKECETIHNQLFKTQSEQINFTITPKEVGNVPNNETENNTKQPYQQPHTTINLGY